MTVKKPKNCRKDEYKEYVLTYRKHIFFKRLNVFKGCFERVFEDYAEYIVPIIIWLLVGFGVAYAFVTVMCVR